MARKIYSGSESWSNSTKTEEAPTMRLWFKQDRRILPLPTATAAAAAAEEAFAARRADILNNFNWEGLGL